MDTARLRSWWPAVCALLAYVPAFVSSPGRMPADTKLALYLDPTRLTTEAADTFDPAQYAGWVPHQQIAYLWPTGPWYSFFEAIGTPDWIAHRLWIGTLLVLAGTGVGWCLRRLGFGVTAALTGALVYQLSPYVLPYISRTSALLLPFAALGWIVGSTILALDDPRRVPWRWPAVIALIVATVGAPNATALLMIVPAPLIVLVLAATRPDRRARLRALRVTGLVAASCTAVSLWWVAMLVVQRTHGADVLAYSESLRSVSTSSTAPEVLRGLGYWLFYVRDHVGATTTASLEHLDVPAVVALGFAAAIVPLVGLVIERSERSRLGMWCVVVGVVVSVGVHPIDEPSPLMRALVGDVDSGLALALRSSTRAAPVIVLGLAIGAAAFVTAPPADRLLPARLARRSHVLVAGAVVVIVFVATPSWWTGALVDPNLDRDPDPPTAWQDAADALGTGTGRVLQLPGAEFGAFDWGVTVDQPLPYLGERPVVTRDLLPLGSAPAMDLLFALDDRFQDGVAEPASLAPVARWLGVDAVWITGDLDVERYDTARPGVTLDVARRAGIGSAATWGEPSIAGVEVIDEELLGIPAASDPVEPVTVVTVDDPGQIVRVRTHDVVLVGAGDGLVDAAAAGVLDGSELVLPAPAFVGEEVDHLVVTDGHRDRSHHWRSSQDVHGFTESDSPTSDLLRDDEADERLPVYDDAVDRAISDDDRTVSEQRGPVTARATAYGEPFRSLPEHRPVMAIDGDHATAWTVAEHANPVGEELHLRVASDARPDRFVVHQPHEPDDRVITAVDITIDGVTERLALDERSWSDAGQRLERVVQGGQTVVIRIASVGAGRPNGVGFSDIDFGLTPTVEWIRTPTALPTVDADGRLDVVATRLRAEATDRWRDDPEPVLRRHVPLPFSDTRDAAIRATVRLDPRATGEQLAALLGDPARSTAHLFGAPRARGAAAIDGDGSTAWVTPFGRPIGPSLALTGVSGRTDRLVLAQPSGPYSAITRIRVEDQAGAVDLPVPPGVSAELPLGRSYDLTSMTITIIDAALAETTDRRHGDTVVLPAAIAELDLGDDATIAAPSDAVEVDCATGWLRVDGVDLPISFDAGVDDLLDGIGVDARVCDPVQLDGSHVDIEPGSVPAGFQLDRVVISAGPTAERQPSPTWSAPAGSDPRTVTIDECPTGCWVVLGQGFNPAWSASVDGRSLGEPTLVDANANGWWLDPFDTPVVVDVEWGAQTPVTVGVVLSVVAVVTLTALLLGSAWRRRERDPSIDWVGAPTPRQPVVVLVSYVAAAGLVVSPVAIVPAAVVAGVIWLARRRIELGPIIALATLAFVALVAAWIVLVVLREQPFPGLGWPGRFERAHRPVLFALLTLLAAIESSRPSAPRSRLAPAPAAMSDEPA